MYIVGIDIAKKSHQAAIMKPDGTLVGRSFRFTNTKQGFEFLMDKLAAVDSSLENFEFGMEATGHYWLNLYTWLADNHATVHVINPLQSDALRNLYIRKTKTDSVDAKIIAQVIRIGQYSETKLADDRMLMMRDLCRQRFFLVDMVANLKRKIIVMMDRIFPEYQGFFFGHIRKVFYCNSQALHDSGRNHIVRRRQSCPASSGGFQRKVRTKKGPGTYKPCPQFFCRPAFFQDTFASCKADDGADGASSKSDWNP